MDKKAELCTVEELLKQFEPVVWYWVLAEVEIEEPDHKCTPDCEHWGKS